MDKIDQLREDIINTDIRVEKNGFTSDFAFQFFLSIIINDR